MVDNGMYIQVLLQVLYQDQHQRQQDRLQHLGMDLNQDHLSAKPGDGTKITNFFTIFP